MEPRFGISELRLRGFRSARNVTLRPAVCTRRRGGNRQVEPARGRLDAADETAPQPSRDDVSFGGRPPIELPPGSRTAAWWSCRRGRREP